ncbi:MULTISPECIES: hypothetical protein [Pseudomonadaceae]|jgi:hypothetical protein|uniref:hypothetical protein n=1 Tax=Pseudomonadaceae TaxID=135621 RepID=UPI00052E0D01|nr:hypothetical protein [Stutzerimonas kunmingensis]CEG52217.1 conserved hypothetical protein [Stutzerimonas xanthomarina]
MTSAPSNKNAELLAATAQQLKDALRRLEKDQSLSASISSLARLSGVHRNTIYNHGWPLHKLKAIKENRAQLKEGEAASKAAQKSPEQLLELSRLEIIYWFTQLQEARNSKTELTKKVKETESSRNFYMRLAQERLTQLNEQALELTKLHDALALQEEEIAILKGRLALSSSHIASD